MKKFLILLLLPAGLILQYCNPAKKVQTTETTTEPTKTTKKTTEPKIAKMVTFDKNIKPIMLSKCGPCHVPPDNKKTSYMDYEASKNNIDDILRRVHLNPDVRGFMPMKREKLADSVINVLEQWKKDGLLEK